MTTEEQLVRVRIALVVALDSAKARGCSREAAQHTAALEHLDGVRQMVFALVRGAQLQRQVAEMEREAGV